VRGCRPRCAPLELAASELEQSHPSILLAILSAS
jgi:hypothetical protein